MKKLIYIMLILTTTFQAYGQDSIYYKSINLVESNSDSQANIKIQKIINSEGQIIETRILCPVGFRRVDIQKNSFAEYLRQLPLKPHNSEVEYYDGTTKSNNDVYDAVVDLEIGNKDLHQCADAIMRLRAEYLWDEKQYNKIHFNFTNGFRVDYSEWMKGKRIVVKGNSFYWTQTGKPSNTYNDFWKYMEIVFSYAGTLSLSKELIPVKINDLQIGDIFIKGGSPGHAIIVVDMAIDTKNNKKIFLLAQSYMPAQEIQILKNQNNKDISPWYSADFGQILETPEWTFKTTDLMRFED
jgi:hypothetical protein